MSDLSEQAHDLLRFWLRSVGSKAPVEVASVILGEHEAYRDLERRWDAMSPKLRSAALEQLVRKVAYGTRPYCMRCGTCCRNSGPTLYPGDEALVRDGIIPRSALLRYKPGTRVFDHYQGKEVALEQELVKVDTTAEGVCPFLQGPPAACAIHQNRPRQCQAQMCWDTEAFEELMKERPLRWEEVGEEPNKK